MPKRPDGFVRAFGMTGLQILSDLEKIEQENAIDLGLRPKEARKRKTEGYNQFEADLRADAARMSELYEIFYCLENSMRRMVSNTLTEAEGVEWWLSERVDLERIRKPCTDRRTKEVNSGITPRSEDMIDYTTFGELSQLITDNWDIFDPLFTSKTAVSNITNQLNLMRGPIAHCNPTDELEHERLSIIVRSWFKLMA